MSDTVSLFEIRVKNVSNQEEGVMALSCRLFLVVILSSILGCGGGGGSSSGGAAATPTVPPAIPTSVTATALAHSVIKATWQAATGATGYIVKFRTSGSALQIAGTVGAVTEFGHRNLTELTQYFYVVVATNSGGESLPSQEANATTPQAPTTAPTAAIGLTATALSSSSIKILWTDTSNNEESFEVQQSTNATSGFVFVDTTLPNVETFTVTGLTAGTQYFFRVRAGNFQGPTPFTNVADATTQAAGGGGSGTWTAQTLPGGTKTQIGLWIVSATNVFTVGQSGTILHFDGTSWATQTSPTTKDLRDVWGASSSALWAVGGNAFTPESTILHFDGTSWATQTSPTTKSLNGVWGFAANNVFAIGNNGTILRFDGTSWATQTSPTTEILGGIFGTSANNVFIVGNNGVILRFDGTSWATQTSPVSTSIVLTGIWGATANDLWAAGRHVITAQPTLLHFDGTSWATQTSPTTNVLMRVQGISATDVWLVGGGTQASPTSPAVIFRRQ